MRADATGSVRAGVGEPVPLSRWVQKAVHSIVQDLSLLGTPPPRGLASVTVYAGPHSCRFALFVKILATVSNEGPGMAVGNHVGPKVSAINMANRHGASVAIESLGFAGNLPVSDEGPLGVRLRRVPPANRRRTAGATLGVDPSKTIGHAVYPESIAVNHFDRLSDDGRAANAQQPGRINFICFEDDVITTRPEVPDERQIQDHYSPLSQKIIRDRAIIEVLIYRGEQAPAGILEVVDSAGGSTPGIEIHVARICSVLDDLPKGVLFYDQPRTK